MTFATTPDPSSGDNAVVLCHLGPDAGPGAGWTASACTLTPFDFVFSPRLARNADGSLWVSWSNLAQHRLLRLEPDGSPAPGWNSNGLAIATYNGNELQLYAPAVMPVLVSVATDATGGAYLLLHGAAASPPGLGLWNDLKLVHVDATGATASGWPAAGRLVSQHVHPYGLAVIGDGNGGVWAGWADVLGTDQPATSLAVHVDASNGLRSPGMVGGGERRLFLPAADGGLYTATMDGSGPSWLYGPPAITRAAYTPPTGGTSTLFAEYYWDNSCSYFGDGALVTLPHGGAIWFWSRVLSSTGLYARRFNAAGEVTAAPPAPAPSSLALTAARFDRGAGLRARATLTAPGSARLEAFDAPGRRVASADVEGLGSRDVTLGGTQQLRPGLYLLRLSQGASRAIARIVALY